MMKKIVLYIFVIFLAGTIFPAKIVPMDEVLKPFAISIYEDRILIREGAKIYIYSLKDFSLIKKFGKRGEGPGEFKLNRGGQLRITIQSGNIIVSSFHRVSYFDMDGKYIKERNFKLGEVYPIGKNFVGRKEFMENGKSYTFVVLYNSDMEEIKVLFRYEDLVQEGGPIILGKPQLEFIVTKNRVFIYAEKDFIIRVFDENGNNISIIRRDYQLIEINDTDKKNWHDELRRRYSFYPRIKHRIKFATHFPAVRYVVYDDTQKKIYAITGKKENKKTECFIFDHKGKFLKRTLLELKSGKYTFHQGKLYQLVENDENEKYELRISEIDGD
jgi:hypothetical protein